jgi:urease accessory protein
LSCAVLELLLADARTPSGGHAHSGGLEPADLAPADVPGFMRARLTTVGRVDAAFACAACACGSLRELLELDFEWAARTPAAPLRQASGQLGRGLLRTAAVWFASDQLLAAYRAQSELTPRPVALGVLGRAGGLCGRGVARASLYDDAAAVAAAAVKLLPLDAAVASSWVLGLAEEIDAIADAVASDAQLPSSATPLLDRRALVHASTDRRLFVS